MRLRNEGKKVSNHMFQRNSEQLLLEDMRETSDCLCRKKVFFFFWQNLFSLRIPPEILRSDGIGAGLDISASLTGIHRTLNLLLLNEQIYEFRKPHPFQVSLSSDSTSMRRSLLRISWLACDSV